MIGLPIAPAASPKGNLISAARRAPKGTFVAAPTRMV